jgi:uncharacterized protein
MDTTATPREDRIALLDVLRGIALLGILIMNVPGFGASFYAEADGSHLWPGAADQIAQATRDALFSGKFNGIFSMLFGLGFTLQFARLERRDPQRATVTYMRRLTVLLVLGLMHGMLFWTGDILTQYALLGFVVMLPLRHAGPRALLIAMAACIAGAIAMAAWRHAIATPESIAALVRQAQAWEASNNRAYGQGTFFEAAAEHAREFAHFWMEPTSLVYNISEMIQYAFTMLLGAYVGRMGWLHRLPELMPKIRRIAVWALVLGLACSAVFATIGLLYRTPGATLARLIARACYWLSRPALMTFYVLTVVQLMQRPRWPQRLAAFAAAGRMPLTNYLMQTAICTTLFYGWGFGLWGKVGPLAGLGLAVAIFVLIQIPLSRWWLARHEKGPLEAAWARLTYGRP